MFASNIGRIHWATLRHANSLNVDFVLLSRINSPFTIRHYFIHSTSNDRINDRKPLTDINRQQNLDWHVPPTCRAERKQREREQKNNQFECAVVNSGSWQKNIEDAKVKISMSISVFGVVCVVVQSQFCRFSVVSLSDPLPAVNQLT
jgi:hypothetical protein